MEETTIDYPRGITFEQVWAGLMENREQLKESERQWNKRMGEWNKWMGDWGNRFGEMVEHLVVPGMIDKFQDLGFVFEKAYHNASIKDRKNNIFAQVDITLENGDKVMLIEVKNKLTTEAVTEHVERMNKVRLHADLHGDKRIFLGAVAGIVMDDNAKAFALKNGFYVLEPAGDIFAIIPPEGEYIPREWLPGT